MAVTSREVKRAGQVYSDEAGDDARRRDSGGRCASSETVAWVYERVRSIAESSMTKGRSAERHSIARGYRPALLHRQDRSADNYPFGLCAVPLTEVVRVHASSGTTGKPITGPYTAGDLNDWTDCMARNLGRRVYQPDDIAQNAYGHAVHRRPGLPPGALPHRLHAGAHQLGADRTADHPDEGFRGDRPLLHAILCPDDRRTRGGAEGRHPLAAPAGRCLRRGALVHRDAPGNRGAHGHQGA